MTGEQVGTALKAWIDEHIPEFLVSLNEKLDDDGQNWGMPIVEDWILCFSIKDISDGYDNVFAITDSKIPAHRIKGLLASV